MNIIDKAIQNTGILQNPFDERDLIFGQNARVLHNIYLEDKNWMPHFSFGERQHGIYYDTMSCVIFSALNIVEAVLNYQLKKGMLSVENVEWCYEKGYIVDGEFNLSDRFNAALSGTTDRGNYARKVWHSIRHDGVVPESMCSWNDGRDAPYEERFGEWFRDPENVSREAIELGQEFIERFDIKYESVPLDEIDTVLHNSPVQVFIATKCPYVSNIQQKCEYNATHAVTKADDDEPRGYIPLFDHYIKQPQEIGNEQFIRRVVSDYKFWWEGYITNITQKNMLESPNKIIKDKHSNSVYFALPITSPEALVSMAHVFGKEIKRTGSGGIDWDGIIEGELEFNS